MRRIVVALAAAAAVAGCAGGPSTGGAPAVVTQPVQVDETANGKTVTVGFGGRLIVVLHSTHWQLEPSLQVLQQFGPPEVAPSPCAVTGAGCGTVTVTYNAAKVGTTTLRAHRSTCGEARRCVGREADWSVTVRVD